MSSVSCKAGRPSAYQLWSCFPLVGDREACFERDRDVGGHQFRLRQLSW